MRPACLLAAATPTTAATPTAASIRAGGGRSGHNGRVIDELIARMAAMLGPLEAGGDQRRYFHATYQRTTIAVADEIKRGGFDDPGWVERWDVAFAGLYLEALEASLAGAGRRGRGTSRSAPPPTCPRSGTCCSA